MTDRHGLTLLEVLFATATLALIAATCAPLLRSARAAMEQPIVERHHFDLQLFADDFLENYKEYGVEDVLNVDVLAIPWPATEESDSDRSTRPAIRIQRLNSSNNEPLACWLAFNCEDSFVLRRIEIEAPKDTEKEQRSQ